MAATIINPQISLQFSEKVVTKEPQISSFVLEHRSTSKIYQMNIIDTPALEEEDEIQNRLGNEDKITTLLDIVRKQIPSLDFIAWISQVGQTNLLDIKDFKRVLDILGLNS